MGSPTKLRLAQGTARSWLLTFTAPDGSAYDLTGATFAAFLKSSVFDADADALTDVSARVAAFDALNGLAIFALLAADTSALDAFAAKEWQVRATLASGKALALEAHQGPLVFVPLLGPADIAEPPNDYLEEIADMSSIASVLSAIDGLLGGTAVKLDGLSTTLLAALPSGQQIDLFFTGQIAARYRLRARTVGEVEASPHVVLCDNDAARCWELVSVSKAGQPCAWNAESAKFHRVWAVGADGAATDAVDASGFSLP